MFVKLSVFWDVTHRWLVVTDVSERVYHATSVTNQRCVTSQEREHLSYTADETKNLTWIFITAFTAIGCFFTVGGTAERSLMRWTSAVIALGVRATQNRSYFTFARCLESAFCILYFVLYCIVLYCVYCIVLYYPFWHTYKNFSIRNFRFSCASHPFSFCVLHK